MLYYNVWNVTYGHFEFFELGTHSPQKMTLEQAEVELDKLNKMKLSHFYYSLSVEHEVRQLNKEYQNSDEYTNLKPNIVIEKNIFVKAINNHICKFCSNDKVSKDESNCWKCGGQL